MAPKDEYPDQPEHPPRFSVSRRDFLKTAGLSSLAAGPVIANVTDPLGRVTREQLDTSGRPTLVLAPDGGATRGAAVKLDVKDLAVSLREFEWPSSKPAELRLKARVIDPALARDARAGSIDWQGHT